MPAIIIKKERGKTGKKPMIMVGKKVSPKATERNRLKRRIKAIFAGHREETGAAYKVIINPEAKKLSFEELKREVEIQLAKLH